jgi:uncharacterized membrane protein
MIMAQDQPHTTTANEAVGPRQQPRVWGPAPSAGQVNVGERERMLSALGGGALALYGLRRGGLGGAVLLALGGGLIYRGYSGHCPAYDAMGMNTAADAPAPPEAYFERGIHVDESVMIDRRPWDLYAFWKDLENLPRFMDHLQDVRKIDDRRSHWVAKAPAGTSVEWDAEIINDEPNALIAWRSLGGASVDNAGSVRFIPGAQGQGTQVRVVLDYIPPAGRVGAAIAKLFGEEPSRQVGEDLRRFKELMEGGKTPAQQ